MLILSRHINESVVITVGDKRIEVMVVGIRRGNSKQTDKVRLGFNADRDVTIHRNEVQSAIERENDQRFQPIAGGGQ